jgi:hypothetical protein
MKCSQKETQQSIYCIYRFSLLSYTQKVCTYDKLSILAITHINKSCQRNLLTMSEVLSSSAYYLGTTVRNQNYVQEATKNRLISGKTSYDSVQNLSSSHRLYKYLKINIYKTIALPVGLYVCETLSLTLKEKYSLRYLRTGY